MFGPNISGKLTAAHDDFAASAIGKTAEGAFYTYAMGKEGFEASNGNRWDKSFAFDASRSSNQYGASSTVQPASLRVLAIIKF